MSTVSDLQMMFADLRGELQIAYQERISNLGEGQKDKKAEAANIWRLMQMGLFVGESLVVDIKRIADGLNEIAMNTQPKG